ncbi:MAG: hypothetical protein AB3A66_30315 (plasmid) [Nodularia sp. CChRGM 3473]
MEQQAERFKERISIQLKTDGELNLSGIPKNLSYEEFLIVQQLIDQSKQRSQNASRVQELMQRGMFVQGVIASFAVLMFLFLGFYSVTRYIFVQINQVEVKNVR